MAVTFTENGTNTPNGVHKEFTYTFTTLRTDGTDVKVSLDGIEQATNKYTVDDTGSPTKITFNDTDPTAGLQVTTAGSDKGAPLTGVIVRVYRETLLEQANTVTFQPGSSIRAADLNANFDMIRYAAQEENTQTIQTKDLADDCITASKIDDGTIVNASINADAEIEVSKLKDGTARQILQTDSGGTGVEWTSNVDIPGTLDVTGAADFDTTINVDGTATLATVDINAGTIDGTTIGGSSAATGVFTTGTIATADINGGAIDGTTIGASSPAAGTFTTGTIATADINGGAIDGTVIGAASTAAGSFTTINASGTITGDVTGDLTGNADTATTATDLAAATKITNAEQAAHTVNDSTYFTTAATEARYFNVSTGETIKDGDTFPDNDTTIATTAAINDRIVDLVTEVGGFVPIANENSFPTTNPDINDGAGTLVSIKALSEDITTGSGVTNNNSIAQTTAGTAVNITGLTESTTYSAGVGMIVETTSTLNEYAFHRTTPDGTDVTTVAGKATEIGRLGTVAAVEDLEILGTTANVTAMGELGTSANVTAMGNLGTAAVVEDMSLLTATGVIDDLETCSNNIANINNVGGSITNVNSCATNLTDINHYGDTYQIATSAPTARADSGALQTGDLWFDSSSNKSMMVYDGSAGDGYSAMTPAQSVLDDIAVVSGNITYTEDLGLITESVSTGTGNSIETCADSITQIQTCHTNVTNINTVAGAIANVNSTGGSIANVNTVAAAIADVNRYANEYTIASTNPSSPSAGDLWYDSSSNNVLNYYNGSSWSSISAGIANIIADTNPALGGHLDCNDKNLTEVGTISGDNLQLDFGSVA